MSVSEIDLPHVEHCCEKHGCKYADPGCPVAAGLLPQAGSCDLCHRETAQRPDKSLESQLRNTVVGRDPVAGTSLTGQRRPTKCRRCDQCKDEEHHWLLAFAEGDDVADFPQPPGLEIGEPFWTCKHCDEFVEDEPETWWE